MAFSFFVGIFLPWTISIWKTEGKDMKVLLLHGWFSTGETKHSSLLAMGHDVIKPSLNNIFFSSAVKSAQDAYDKYNPDVIVGSSRGGAVALNMKSNDTPLLLIAPAWKRFGNRINSIKNDIYVMHSIHDNTISYDDSLKLVKLNPNISLFTVGNDHQLNCTEGFNTMKSILNYIKNRNCNIKVS